MAGGAPEGDVELRARHGGHTSEQRYRPPGPVAPRRERAADDDGGLSLQRRPHEQHRAAVAVNDGAELHRRREHASAQVGLSSRASKWPSMASSPGPRTRTSAIASVVDAEEAGPVRR